MERLRLRYPKTVVISALEKTGFEELMQVMMQELSLLRHVVKLKIPQSEYALVAHIRREGKVLYEEYEENEIIIRAEIPLSLAHRFDPYRDDSQL